MKTLLRIDASIRSKGSHSKALADFYEKNWKKAYPNGTIIYRDLSTQNIPHLSTETVEAFYTPQEVFTKENDKAIALSNALIAELKLADFILISSPLYNLNVPSKLKAYLDHIIRSGITFKVDNNGNYIGLLNDKEAHIITTKGETYKNTPMEALDYQEPYLKTILQFIGIELKSIFSLEATAHAELLKKNIELQHNNIINSFQSFAL